MIDFLWNTASFIIALGILVTIHEYGHFWVARKLGVKVLRFSIGFGKPLWSKTAKDGTEYILAAIPLGGYVKMLDEREGDVADDEKHQAFNRQPVSSRIAIVLAGPMANFLLAIGLYWWMFLLGVPALKPYLGEIPVESIAFEAGLKAGDEIITIDGKSVGNFREVSLAVARRMGETSEILMTVRHAEQTLFPQDKVPQVNVQQHVLQLQNWQIDSKQPDVLRSLGVTPWRPHYPAMLGAIIADQAASRSGLKQGDIIISIDDKPMNDWVDVVSVISGRPDSALELEIKRDSEVFKLEVFVGSHDVAGEKQGFLGVGRPELSKIQQTQMQSMRYRQQYGFFESITQAIDKTWEITLLTFRFIGKIFSGEVSPQNLGGPITIAQGAGAYASYGFVFFLNFLGMISVNLGIINLLPVPVLDGGHLLYYVVELIRGKPLSESIQEIGYRIGMVLVLSLMVFTLFNDISRL